MFNRLDLPSRGIDSLAGLATLQDRNIVFMNLEGNRISHFHNIGTHAYMTALNVSENHISSLFGLTRQPRLEVVQLRGNPIAQHPLYRIMVLQSVGFSVQTIDGTDVSSEERKMARELGPHAALAVACGWLLDLQPRSDAAYLEEAQKSKKAHAAQLQKHTARCTVLDALSSAAPTSTASPRPMGRVLEHLSARVRTLEADICRLEAEKKALRVRGRGSAGVLTVSPLSAAAAAAVQESTLQVATASCVEFDQGIQAVTDAFAPLLSSRVCLRITDTTLSVLSLLHRHVVAEIALNGSTRIEFNYPNRLVVSDGFGATAQMDFATLLVLYSVYHALSLKAFGSVTPFPFMDDELDRMAKEAAQRTAALRSADAPDGAGDKNIAVGGHPHRDSERSVESDVCASVLPAHTVSEGHTSVHSTSDTSPAQMPPSAHSVRAVGVVAADGDQLDWVTDIPPLPPSPANRAPSAPMSTRNDDGGTASGAPVTARAPTGATPIPAAVSRFQNLLVSSSDTSALSTPQHSHNSVIAADSDRHDASALSSPPAGTAALPPEPQQAAKTEESCSAIPTPAPASASSEAPAGNSAEAKANGTPPAAPPTTTVVRRFQAFMIDSDSDSDA